MKWWLSNAQEPVGAIKGNGSMEEAVRQELAVGFVTQIDASVDKPQAADLYPVGTSASVLRIRTS